MFCAITQKDVRASLLCAEEFCVYHLDKQLLNTCAAVNSVLVW